jgi:hypothetical protein
MVHYLVLSTALHSISQQVSYSIISLCQMGALCVNRQQSGKNDGLSDFPEYHEAHGTVPDDQTSTYHIIPISKQSTVEWKHLGSLSFLKEVLSDTTCWQSIGHRLLELTWCVAGGLPRIQMHSKCQ